MEFFHWLESLRQSAGEPYLWAINRISPYILETFWQEGCEPTLEGVIRHCESESLRYGDMRTEPWSRSPDSAGPSGSAFAAAPEAARSGGSSLQPVFDGGASTHCLGNLERGNPA